MEVLSYEENFKTYFLSNFQIYNNVFLIRVTMGYFTSPDLISENLYFMTTFIHLTHPQIPSASYSVLSAYTSSPCNISLVPPNMPENSPQAIAPYKCMSEREVCFLHPGEEVLSFVSFSLYSYKIPT